MKSSSLLRSTTLAALAAFVFVMLIAAPLGAQAAPGAQAEEVHHFSGFAPPKISPALARTIMTRYPDFRTAYWKPWTYVNGYVLLGIERLYRDTGDPQYLDYIQRYVDHFVDEHGNFTAGKLDSLDDMLTGTVVIGLYEMTGDARYRIAAEHIRHALDHYPRSSDGEFWHNAEGPDMWIDGLFMGQMFVLRYGKSIGDSQQCWDEATKQILIFAKHAHKGDSGLYYHAWTERKPLPEWADEKTGVSREVWSEGLGWYALVLSEALAVLPKDHPNRAAVEDVYRRLAAALKRTQDAKSGGWYMIVDKGGEKDNWIDPSGTAMFTYAIQRGIDLGLLDKDAYERVAERGYAALWSFVKRNSDGLFDVVGGGDGICIHKDYASYVNYKRQVNAKETVAGVLWGTEIIERPLLAGAPPMTQLYRFSGRLVPEMGLAETAVEPLKPAKLTPAGLPGNGMAQHPMLYIGEGYDRMMLVNGGKIAWSYQTGGGWEYDDVWMLSNGNVLFTRMQYVAEVTPEKKVVWRYDAPEGTEIHTCQPIGLDRVMFVQNGLPPKLFVVNIKSGAVEVEHALPAPSLTDRGTVHGQFRRARYTVQGTYLLSFLTMGKVVEYDRDFHEIWSYEIPAPWAAVRLKNGNTLITGERDIVTREVNQKKETVWELKPTDLPEGWRFLNTQSATRLANGNTIVCSRGGDVQGPQLVEVTPEKKVVWVLQDWEHFGPATAVQILDEPGVPEIPGESQH